MCGQEIPPEQPERCRLSRPGVGQHGARQPSPIAGAGRATMSDRGCPLPDDRARVPVTTGGRRRSAPPWPTGVERLPETSGLRPDLPPGPSPQDPRASPLVTPKRSFPPSPARVTTTDARQRPRPHRQLSVGQGRPLERSRCCSTVEIVGGDSALDHVLLEQRWDRPLAHQELEVGVVLVVQGDIGVDRMAHLLNRLHIRTQTQRI